MTLALAAHNLPAAALSDPTLADWARAHSVSVTAHHERDLDLVRRHRIRPFQIVYRCGPDSAVTRRAVALGYAGSSSAPRTSSPASTNARVARNTCISTITPR